MELMKYNSNFSLMTSRSFVLAYCLFIATGCGNHQEQAKGTAAQADKVQEQAGLSQPKPITPTDTRGWVVSNETTTNKAVTLTKSEMPKDQQESLRTSYRQTDLQPVPVDPSYNVNLFRIKQVPEWADTVFIAPRLLAYSNAQKGRMAPELHSDGTVTLPFPVVIIDGTEASITSPDITSKINVTDTMLIHKYTEMKANLDKRAGKPLNYSVLPGCPKKVVIKVNDTEYEATPSDLAVGDYCQLNTPFTVSLRVPQKTAQYIVQKALYNNAVDVRAVFETRVAFVVRSLHIMFDKAKIFTDIEAQLSVNAGPYADVDIHAKITNILRTESMNVSIQGELDSKLEKLVDQAIELFFIKYKPDPATGLKPCGDGVIVCARLNYNYSKESETFGINWDESTNALTGQNYITWTKLQPLMDKVVDIGNTAGRPTLSNKENNYLALELTAVSGDLLKIVPSYLDFESRGQDHSYTRESHRHCEIQCFNAGFECNSGGWNQYGYAETDCRACDAWKQLGRGCTIDEDRWIERETYGLEWASNMVHRDQPIGQMQQIFDGLKLRFSWTKDGKKKEITCPLNLFAREADGSSIIVRLENMPGCQPFEGEGANNPSIYLQNNIEFPYTYRRGTQTRSWNGVTSGGFGLVTYMPRVEFAGIVSILGYDFGGLNSGGSRLK